MLGKSWKQWMIVISMLLVTVAAAIISARCLTNSLPLFGQYHDDAIYVVTAKSLAQGTGYKIISLPSAPAQTKYPILYPFLLSLLWRLQPRFPDNLVLLQASGLVLAFAFVAISVLYLRKRRRITSLMSVVIFAATLLNVQFVSFAPLTMSDFLYAILSVITLWFVEAIASRKSAHSWALRSVGAGLLEALCAHARGIGTIAGPIVAVYFLILRKYREAILSAVVFLLCLLPWWLWQRASSVQQPQWLSYYTSYGDWFSGTYSGVGAVALIMGKLNEIFMAVPKLVWPLIDQMQYAKLSPLAFFLVYRLGFFLLWTALLAGMVRDLRHRSRCILPLYVIGYAVTMEIWPAFLEWRLILVVLPFLYYFYYCCFRDLSRLVKRAIPKTSRCAWQAFCRAASVLFACYLIVGSVWVSLEQAAQYPRLLLARPDISAEAGSQDILETYDWIRTNTATDDIIVCNNESLIYLHTGRQALRPSPYEGWRVHSLEFVTPATVTSVLRGSHAGYVLLDPSLGGQYQIYAQFAAALDWLHSHNPGLLTPVYISKHGVMFVFRVNQDLLKR